MNNKNITKMNVVDNEVRVMRINGEDYISLTDIARFKNDNVSANVLNKWFSNFDTVEFLGLWEELNNIDFNFAEFREIKIESPKKSFTLSPSKWVSRVNAIGIIPSKGKYSVGVFVYSDIAA